MNKETYLNTLNKLLTNAEQDNEDRVTTYLTFGEDKKDNNPFTTDYEVKARIDYFLQGKEDSAHSFWMLFDYKRVIVNKDFIGQRRLERRRCSQARQSLLLLNARPLFPFTYR